MAGKKTKASPRKGKTSAKPKKAKTRKRITASKTKTTAKSKKSRSIWAWLFKWIFVLGLWGFILVGLILAYYAQELPDITNNASFERQNAITVKAADGSTLARYGELKGNTVQINDLPNTLIYAVLATEDRRFYDHQGVDPLGILRALFTNIAAGRTVQGGSTITQQLAKNLFLNHQRTLKRKIQEAMLAIWLEQQLSKDEILSAYLNRVYLGSGAYGMDAAAELYFNKSVSDISLRESAILAGLLKAPSRYSPLRNPRLSQERANVVLSAMADAGYITNKQAKDLAQDAPRPRLKPSPANTARYFTDWVVDGLDDLVGTPANDLIIETTLDADLQNHAQNALQNYLNTNGTDKNIEQGAILFMADDGAVLTMIGGKNYKESQFNRAIQAIRPPGSAFKPIVYLTALIQGWTPQTQIEDNPIETGEYHPENFGDTYYGLVNIDTALMLSLNTAVVRTMQELGSRPVIKTARALGIISSLDANLSLALGSSGVSMLEMVTAYGVIANHGLKTIPYAITRITDKDGEVYYQRPDVTWSTRVIPERSAKDLTAMLRSVVENGTGRAAALPGINAAGKTGTSQDFRDAWFIGFTDHAIGAVWLGNDDNTPMNEVTGGSGPARIWKDVATHIQTQNTGMLVEQDQKGFSGLLGRLISGGNTTAPTPAQKNRASSHNNNARYNN